MRQGGNFTSPCGKKGVEEEEKNPLRRWSLVRKL